MAKKIVAAEIEVKTANSIADLKALKKQLKETAAGSAEFDKLYNQIDDLEDKIKGSKKASSDWIDTLESAGGPIGAVGAALNKAKVATQSFSGALKATGIGLFVAAIGGLVAAFSQNEDAMKKLQPIMDGFGKILNGILGALQPLIDGFIDFATKALPYVTQGFGVAYSALSSFLQGLGMVGSAVKKFISGDFAGAWNDAKKSVTEFGTRYEEANGRFIKGSEQLTDKEKAELDKRLEQQKAAAAIKEAELIKAQEHEQAELLKSYEEYLKRREFARKNSQILTQEEIAKNKQLDVEEQIKTNDEETNRNLEWQNKSLGIFSNSLYSQLEVQKGTNDAKKKLTEEERSMRVNALLDIADTMVAVGSIIGDQTKAGKALGIASALINTYVGASEVIRAKSILPEPFGTIAKIASVAAIIANGIKSVRAITSVQVPNVPGGKGGGSSVSMPSIPSMSVTPMPSVSAPLIPRAQQTTINQDQINQMGNQAQRAYVVESDVSGNQERIMRLNRAARIN